MIKKNPPQQGDFGFRPPGPRLDQNLKPTRYLSGYVFYDSRQKFSTKNFRNMSFFFLNSVDFLGLFSWDFFTPKRSFFCQKMTFFKKLISQIKSLILRDTHSNFHLSVKFFYIQDIQAALVLDKLKSMIMNIYQQMFNAQTLYLI